MTPHMRDEIFTILSYNIATGGEPDYCCQQCVLAGKMMDR